MPVSVHLEMQDLCRKLNVGFLSSAFTIGSARFLIDKMGQDKLKLASSRVTDLKLHSEETDGCCVRPSVCIRPLRSGKYDRADEERDPSVADADGRTPGQRSIPNVWPTGVVLAFMALTS
jgi:hypothetical protein